MRSKNVVKYAVIGLAVLLVGVIMFAVFTKGHDHTASGIKYHCPMHPTYIADKPGDCPICGMKLVPMQEKASEEKKKIVYRSTMLPNEVSDKPGKDSMGMDMVAVEAAASALPSKVSGLESVNISSEQEQLIGVKTDVLKKRNLELSIRAGGRVAHDPELYNALSEYKQTLLTYEDMKSKDVSAEILKQTWDLLESSKFKLTHLGLSEEQINKMVKENNSSSLLLVNKSGGTVWIYAQVYEYEAGLVKEGQKIEFSSIAFPGKKFSGTIKSIDTYLDSETRTLKVRAEVQNKEGLLKPEMYVDASIFVDLGKKLAVPLEAVLDTGVRKIVFVKVSKGVYEPREIVTGYQADKYYEIISGVKEGETVVTSANFLIDSESRLKSAISGAGGK